MVVFPNCKINLGLRITGRRPDGYHDLETVFYPLPWHDALEIIPANVTGIFETGQPTGASAGNNICMRAYDMLKKEFPFLPPVEIHLHKTIPAGAGLGGGSSDGAFTLKLLNDMFSTGLSENELKVYALELGSDCPFFILNRPSLARGRGEILEPMDLDLSGYHFALVNPGIHISTGWAFSQIQSSQREYLPVKLAEMPVEQWKDFLVNDFETAVFVEWPVIREIKDILYKRGALYASLTGTGSTVYGIFRQKPAPFEFPSDYIVKLTPG